MDIENILNIILPYYGSYCNNRVHANCHTICSDNLLLTSNGKINKYTFYKYPYNGRIVYQSESKSLRLYYGLSGWAVSTHVGSTDDDNIIMKTSKCPQEGGEFEEKEVIFGGNRENVDEMTKCSVACQKRPDCKFWQWNKR